MALNGAADLAPRAEPETQLAMPPEMFAGVWANYASIAQTEHEVTIDFYRVGPGGQQGICVARVNCSPQLLAQLQESFAQHVSA